MQNASLHSLIAAESAAAETNTEKLMLEKSLKKKKGYVLVKPCHLNMTVTWLNSHFSSTNHRGRIQETFYLQNFITNFFQMNLNTLFHWPEKLNISS